MCIRDRLPPSAVTTQVLLPPSALTTTIHYSRAVLLTMQSHADSSSSSGTLRFTSNVRQWILSNCITLNFDLLNSFFQHHWQLSWIASLPALVLIAQAIFLLECGKTGTHTETHKARYNWSFCPTRHLSPPCDNSTVHNEGTDASTYANVPYRPLWWFR